MLLLRGPALGFEVADRDIGYWGQLCLFLFFHCTPFIDFSLIFNFLVMEGLKFALNMQVDSGKLQ